MTFKKVEKLVYKIQLILDRIESKEISGARNVYKTNLGETYYQKKANDIYKLAKKLEKATQTIPDTLPLRQILNRFNKKWHSADTIFKMLKEQKSDLAADLFGINLQIPERSLSYNAWDANTTGEKIALILLLVTFLFLIPGGLIYWAIAGKTILPVILLTIYLALAWLVAKFLKGFRNAFRR